MRTSRIYKHNRLAGFLTEFEKNKKYKFSYDENHIGEIVSLTMSVELKEYSLNSCPPFLDGLLPKVIQLDGLLRFEKIDKDDYFSQLIVTGADLVRAVSVEGIS